MPKYTTPRLYKGKPITHVPKGSSKLKEEAKQVWYVNYSYEGKQHRVKGDINRIKDHNEKAQEASILLESIKQDLANGYNPNDESAWIAEVLKSNISLDDAILKFESYHKMHNSRPKTIQGYLSKLNALSAFYPNILLSAITTKLLERFVQSKINDGTYSQDSVKNAKRTFSTFFNVCIKLEFIQNNPIKGFDSKIKSIKVTKGKHVPYSDEDLKSVLDYMDANDRYAAFFCRMIYYTCLRPSEIRGLRIRNIDLENGKIVIPPHVKKVTRGDKADILDINDSFIPFLSKLDLASHPVNYYLTGSTKDIIGEKKVGENTPYNKLVAVLKELKLNEKGYDLYSFKHTSNIKKYMDGWTLAEIMKANRHTSITTTEIYLRQLVNFVDIKAKPIPVI